jgi:hypothetical protein
MKRLKRFSRKPNRRRSRRKTRRGFKKSICKRIRGGVGPFKDPETDIESINSDELPSVAGTIDFGDEIPWRIRLSETFWNIKKLDFLEKDFVEKLKKETPTITDEDILDKYGYDRENNGWEQIFDIRYQDNRYVITLMRHELPEIIIQKDEVNRSPYKFYHPKFILKGDYEKPIKVVTQNFCSVLKNSNFRVKPMGCIDSLESTFSTFT